jgi:CubicO group peptidase (beta-lactamase class C family)
MLVMRDGKIIFEDYRNNSQPTDRFISFSMAKSITSLLVGLALDRGFIHSLDDTAGQYVPELKSGAYGDVSIRHILQCVRASPMRNAMISAQRPALPRGSI